MVALKYITKKNGQLENYFMENLATYNRVRKLAHTPYKNLLSASYLLLLFIVFISLGDLWLKLGNDSYAKLAIALAISAGILLKIIELRHKQHCQFCAGPLVYINRPFILSPRFLAMNGKKLGQSFYTYKSNYKLVGNKHWVKISIRSLACHHCRLTEEKQIEHQEPANSTEVQQLTE